MRAPAPRPPPPYKLPSCAHWLNFKCGLNLGAAREKVRVGHALAGLPKIAASMARGELSYSKVRALTRVACTATEDTLLMIALHGTAFHVERLVSGFRRAQEAEALSREAQQHTQRSVNYWFAEDGSLVFKARLPAVAGALLIRALDAALEVVPQKEIRAQGVEERYISYASRRADALAVVAEGFLAAPATASSTADRSSADRYQVVVHVDAETLHERGPGRCEIEHGPSIPIETARRLSCDASHDGEELQRSHTALGVHIDSNTAATRWRGERMDYELGAWVLCNQVDRARAIAQHYCDVAAETPEAADVNVQSYK
jgi:hypothetical protein